MRHFTLLLLISLCACSGSAWAQFKSVPTSHEQIKQEAQQAPLALQFQGSSEADFKRWHAEFSAKLRGALGNFAPPKEWETILEGSEEHTDFVRERLVLKSPGHPSLPLYRLIPKPLPKERCPAVLAIHGHGGVYYVVGVSETNGVFTEVKESVNDYGRQFVKRGYIVVAPIMTPFRPREPNEGYEKGDDRCAVAFVRLQLLGKLLIAEYLRDCLWGFELLAKDKRVDPERIGCAGLSYGGRMTMLTAALEPRIRVAAVSGACNVMQERVQVRYSCGAQVIPGLLQFGDVPEIGSLIAPRPAVWEIGAKDKLMDPFWVDKACERMRKAYKAAGVPEKLVLDRFAGEHVWHGEVAHPLFDEMLKPAKPIKK